MGFLKLMCLIRNDIFLIVIILSHVSMIFKYLVNDLLEQSTQDQMTGLKIGCLARIRDESANIDYIMLIRACLRRGNTHLRQ